MTTTTTPERPYTKYELVAGSYAHVLRVLIDAGFVQGKPPRPEALIGVAAPPERGFVVDTRYDWQVPDSTVRHVFIDHVGPRRDDALKKYRRALERAGLTIHTGPAKHHDKTLVLWVGKPIHYEPHDPMRYRARRKRLGAIKRAHVRARAPKRTKPGRRTKRGRRS